MNGPNHRHVLLRVFAVIAMACVDGLLAPPSTRAADQSDGESCSVGAAELARWYAREGLVVVDTGSDHERRQVWIPGSLASAPQALRYRAHLARSPLLLVPRGPAASELLAVCRDLRARGFHAVGVFEGGLRAWVHAGYPVAGDAAARRELSQVHAADVWRDRDTARWLVVDATAGGTSAVRELSRRTVRIPAGDMPRFQAALRWAVGRHEARQRPPFVVVVDDDGARRVALEAVVAAADRPHVYFLVDGADGLERFRAAHRAIVATRGACPSSRCGPGR